MLESRYPSSYLFPNPQGRQRQAAGTSIPPAAVLGRFLGTASQHPRMPFPTDGVGSWRVKHTPGHAALGASQKLWCQGCGGEEHGTGHSGVGELSAGSDSCRGQAGEGDSAGHATRDGNSNRTWLHHNPPQDMQV